MAAVPTDPFDGKPLRFKPLANGYVIYSVGDDRRDNGGTQYDFTGAKRSDVTFIVERVIRTAK
jgi:hypothetical protein